KRGRMHRSFNDMESWEMLWITCTPRMGDARALRYMTDIVHYRWNKYWGACWSISYRGTNQFGTSIHSRDYYYPWQNEFTGEVLKHRMGGGVCGTLSNFGSGLARAHGVPSFPVGQPGHCAYMLRPGTSYWGTAYSVTGDTRAGTFFDSGDETIVRLTQDAFKKETRSKLLTSSIYDWMAIFLEKQYPTFTDAERTARELSLKAHPIHYNHWKRYAKRLASAEPKTTSKEWASFSHRFVKALGHYQRPCLNFLTAYIVPNLKSFTPKECMDMATDWHQMLPKKGEGIHQCSSRHFPRYLASHANKFKNDPVLAATFFRMLLGEYAGSQHFSNVLSWGKANLTNKKESTAKFINTLSSFSKNNKQASQGFSHILGQIIIDAEKNGDVDTFNSTSWLGDSLFSGADKASEKEFSHIYHTSKKTLDTRAPKQTKKFKGKLLSANALPFIEFPHSPKTGLSHRAALQPDRLGFLITQKKKRPRIDIKLPGRCKLSGITIVSRFETSTARSFPMKVSASIDGKKWKHLVTFKDPKAMHEADLSTKLPEALWVRFERDNDKVDYFELRAVRIYGKQLY
ncbi:MAG: hypothetical protein KAG98_01005, partial [Lentisphaeria bacterium]|nr:hypothetical protein [Lentisphaeria bacterium]